jgi:gliding motility-associated-like protein
MKLIFLSVFCLFISHKFLATHIAGGDITYTCLGGTQYQINMNLFIDCFGGLEPGATEFINLQSTCGGSLSVALTLLNPGGTEISQLCPSQTINSNCNGGSLPGMKVFRYSGLVDLNPACDTWTASWGVCCRNAAILNLESPDLYGSYIETNINTITSPCNNSPTFNSQPIPYVCVNQPVSYDYGIIETDGDSLHFSLVNALDGGTALDYNPGYTASDPIPGIFLDPNTGLLTFTPTMLGNFVVVVMVEEFDANGNLMGTVMRDIQFVVENCSNILPDPQAGTITNLTGTSVQTGPYSLELCEGSIFTFDAVYTDANAGDILTLISNITTVLPGSTINFSGSNPLTATISWTATPGSSDLNTVFNVSISDGACPIMGLQNYIYDIRVLSRTSAGPDITICGIQQAQLNAIGGSVFTWNVLSGEAINVGSNFSCQGCPNPIATPTITTTYEVVSDLSGTCLNRDTVTVNVVPDFNLTVSKTTDVNSCSGNLVQLNADALPLDAYTFLWTPATYLDNNSISNPIADILAFGTFSFHAQVTSSLGCVKEDSITTTVNIVPSLLLVADTTICVGESVDLMAFFGNTLSDDFNGATVNSDLWSNVNNASLNTDCGSVSGNALHFNDATTRIAVTQPINAIAGGEITFSIVFATGVTPCEDADAGEDVVLEYSIDGGTNWINIATYGANTFTSFTSITEQIPPGAMTATTLFRWRQVSFSGSNTDNWALDDVTIDVSSDVTNFTYEWFDGSTSLGTNDTINVTPSQTTTYHFVMSETTLNCTITDSITIYAGQTYTLASTNDTILCSVTSLNLSVLASNNQDNIYLWSPATTLASPNDSVTLASPASTTTYYVNVMSPDGCERIDSVTVTIANQITLALLADTSICLGESVDLMAFFGNTITDDFNGATINTALWSNVNGALMNTNCGSVTGNSLHFDAGVDRIAVTQAINAIVGGEITFSIVFGTGVTPCEAADFGEDVVLEYSIDGGTNWINIATYDVNSYTTFTNITVPIPPGAMTSSTLFRWRQVTFSGSGFDNWALDDVTIDVSSDVTNFSYEWFDGSTSLGINDTLNVTPTQTTMYHFVMTDNLLSCQITDSIQIVTAPDFALLSSNDTTLCGPSSINLITTPLSAGNYTYLWSPSATIVDPNISNTVANPTASVDYVVEVSSDLGCTKRDTVSVVVQQIPVVNSVADQTICSGASFNDVIFTGTSGATYDWTNNNTAVGLLASGSNDITTFTTTSVTTTEIGLVTVTPMLNGCEGSSITFDLTVNPLENPNFTFSSADYCPEESDPQASITGLAGGSFSAQPNGLVLNSSTGVVDLSASTPGTYMITYTTSGVCFDTNNVSLTIFNSPVVSAGVDTTICDNQSYVFSGSGALSYTWDQGIIDNQSVNLTADTVTYTVTGTDANGCTDTDQIVVTVVATPVPNFTASPTEGYSPLVVDFQNLSTNATNYSWNFDDGSPVIDTGTLDSQNHEFIDIAEYNVTLTADNGVCITSYTSIVIVKPIEDIELYIPNIFTPNNDTKNDMFWIDAKHVTSMHVEIYNRWGNKMFTIEDVNTKWDGTVEGKEAADGVYFFKYIIDGKNGLRYTGQGNVQLIR